VGDLVSNMLLFSNLKPCLPAPPSQRGREDDDYRRLEPAPLIVPAAVRGLQASPYGRWVFVSQRQTPKSGDQMERGLARLVDKANGPTNVETSITPMSRCDQTLPG
jgi:hypothetical protein